MRSITILKCDHCELQGTDAKMMNAHNGEPVPKAIFHKGNVVKYKLGIQAKITGKPKVIPVPEPTYGRMVHELEYCLEIRFLFIKRKFRVTQTELKKYN